MFWIYYKSDIESIGPVGSQLNFPGHLLLSSLNMPLTLPSEITNLLPKRQMMQGSGQGFSCQDRGSRIEEEGTNGIKVISTINFVQVKFFFEKWFCENSIVGFLICRVSANPHHMYALHRLKKKSNCQTWKLSLSSDNQNSFAFSHRS